MTTNNSLTANNFSFYDPHSYGYGNNAAQTLSRFFHFEHCHARLFEIVRSCSDYQAVILINQPSS